MRTFLTALLLAAALSSSPAQADIFKCEDDDGNMVFQQTPCAERESVKVDTGSASVSADDCVFANKFAVSSARFMRRGVRSDQLFDRYGGLDSLSRGSLGVINYVYTFRTNADVSVERIAALAQAKCRAKSFGDVSCEALPLSFTEGLGGCDATEEERLEAQAKNSSGADQVIGGEPVHLGAPRPNASGSTSSSSAARSDEAVAKCKKKYRDAIDAIDAKMRSGYSSSQGEAYRQQLRGLTEKLRAC